MHRYKAYPVESVYTDTRRTGTKLPCFFAVIKLVRLGGTNLTVFSRAMNKIYNATESNVALLQIKMKTNENSVKLKSTCG